jgi:hypothetical protein
VEASPCGTRLDESTTRFPSISMLNRVDGLLDQLEEAEQRQQLASAQSDGAGSR